MSNVNDSSVELASANYGAWLDLREVLISRRRSLEMTQSELAEVMGITQSAVSQFESLGGNPRLMTIIAYAQALNLKLSFGASEIQP